MSKLNFQHHYPSKKKLDLISYVIFIFKQMFRFKGVHFCW